MFNKVILAGSLGRDPEVKYTTNGTSVADMSMATSEYYNGENHTEWHKLVAFGKTAEIAGKHLVKGSKVMVEGKLQTDKWEDKDGNTRYTTKVIVNRITFLEPKGSGGSGYDQHQNTPSGPQDNGGEDDDIPF